MIECPGRTTYPGRTVDRRCATCRGGSQQGPSWSRGATMRNAAGDLKCRAGLVGATALCLTSSSCMQPGTTGWQTAKLSTAPSQQSQRCLSGYHETKLCEILRKNHHLFGTQQEVTRSLTPSSHTSYAFLLLLLCSVYSNELIDLDVAHDFSSLAAYRIPTWVGTHWSRLR